MYLKLLQFSVISSLAQLAERKTVNLEATGSIPVGRETFLFFRRFTVGQTEPVA